MFTFRCIERAEVSSKRQALIDTALKLFAEHGFHSTGIDWIAEEAKVSKKTMYQHFRSKEELIVAVLRQHDGMFRNHFMKSVQQASENPREQLLAIFDVAYNWFEQKDFYGCLFINATGEYSDRNPAIQSACLEYKRMIRQFIEQLTRSAGVPDPEKLASELSILLEGAIVTSQVSGIKDSAKTAKLAAKTLIDAALQSR